MIRVITDEHFMELLSLYIKMYNYIDPSLRASQVSIILAEEMRQQGFIVFGLFTDEDKLIGFLSGYNQNGIFFNSGLYSESRIKVKELITKAETHLSHLGYLKWATEAKGHIKSLAPKFGAKIDYIRYIKEI